MMDRNVPPLNILLLAADRFPPFRVDVSVLFGKELTGRGHRIDWLLQSEAAVRMSYETQWSSCRVWVGKTDTGSSILSRVRKNLYELLHDLKVFRLLKKEKYELVIVRDKFFSAVAALIAAKCYGVRFGFWLSYPFPEDYLYQVEDGTARYPLLYWMRGHILKILCYRVIMRWSDHSFVQTEYMRKMIAGYGVSPRRMTSVPMAVRVEDIPFFGTNGDTAPHGEKHIVYLGTLFRSRKMDFLVRAFGKVMKCEPRARLWLVGGGEDPKDERIILEEAGRLGIRDRVSITGFLPQVEAWRYVGEASVCVSPIVPSPVLDCGSPTKLIEYLAMGKASVANDHPEQSVVMAESRAGICVPYDENVFAGAILHILNHPHEAAEMGRRGRKYIESTRTYGQAGDLVESTLLRLCRTSDKARHET